MRDRHRTRLCGHLWVAALVSALLGPRIGHAEPVGGAEFAVNAGTANFQFGGYIGVAANGSFVISWADFDAFYGPVRKYVRRFDSNGTPLAGDQRADTSAQPTTADEGFPYPPAVLVADDGRFVVGWEGLDTSPDPDEVTLSARRFGSDGAPAGAVFAVNQGEVTDDPAGAAAMAADGSFLVVWESPLPGPGETSLRAQRFDASFAKAGSEFEVVRRTGTYRFDEAAVGARSDGDFLVVWEDVGNDGDGTGDEIVVFTVGSDARGPATPTTVNPGGTAANDTAPKIAVAADNSFVIVWTRESGAYDVIGRAFDASGAAVGGEFTVPDNSAGIQEDVSIAALDSGGFVAVWTDGYEDINGRDGSESGIFGRLLASDGTPVATDFAINQFTTNQQGGPFVAAAGGDSFIVSWTSVGQDGSPTSAFARIFDAGSPTTTDTTTTTTTTTTSTTTTSTTVTTTTLLGGCPVSCGNPTGTSTVSATDALIILKTSVGLVTTNGCPCCACDVDASSRTTATDALVTLKNAVGVPDVRLVCIDDAGTEVCR